MFYYAVLLFAMFHLFALSHTVRIRETDENTKVLIYLSAAVALSIPLLGLLGHARLFTAIALAAVLLLYTLRNKITDTVKVPLNRWLYRYEKRRPYPCLAVSFAGLLSWAWYHP